MSSWTSSLRPGRDWIVAGLGLALLACPSTALGAGGTPMPAPDDPPVSSTVSTTAVATGSTSVARSGRRAAESAQSVPTPDAPLGQTATSEPAATTHTTPAPQPDVSSTQHVTAVVSARPAAVSPTRRRPAPVARTGKPASSRPARAERAPAPAPARKRPAAPVHRASVPRDAVRLGLPVGLLRASRPEGDESRALLFVAACLFAVAAGGSTVLGAAARNAARQA